MKVVVTFTSCCDNYLEMGKVSLWLWKSLENSEFFSPTLWPPCESLRLNVFLATNSGCKMLPNEG